MSNDNLEPTGIPPGLGMDSTYSRRRVIQLLGVAGAGIVATPLLSACGEDEEDGDDSDEVAEAGDEEEDEADAADDSDEEPDEEDSDDDAQEASGDEPKRGGTFQWFLPDDPPDLDPHQQTTSSLQWTLGLCYNGLLRFDIQPGHGPTSEEAATPVPDLATDYEVSEDGLTYTFQLREGVLFHDGEEFTAEDAAYSLDRIRTDEPQFQRAYAFTPVSSTEATSDYELTVSMDEPYAAFINQIAVAYTRMAPMHVIEAEGDMQGEIVGTGPFRLQEYQRGDRLILEANPDYWEEDIPYLDAIEMVIMPDSSTQLSSFMAGQLDLFTASTASEMETVVDAVENVEYFEYATFGLAGIGCNTEVEPFGDVRVRQALWYALDQEEIIRVVYQGHGEDRRRAVPPQMVGWPVPFEDLPLSDAPNLDRARELLEEAGYPDGFDVTIKSVYRYTQEDATVFAEMLREIGVNAEIEDVEYGAFLDARNNGDFELIAFALAPFGDIEDFTTALYHTEASRNYGTWGNEELDELFDAGRQELDVEARQEIFADVQEILAEQCWVIDLARGNVFDMWQPRVRDFVSGQNPQRGLGLRYVWLDE